MVSCHCAQIDVHFGCRDCWTPFRIPRMWTASRPNVCARVSCNARDRQMSNRICHSDMVVRRYGWHECDIPRDDDAWTIDHRYHICIACRRNVWLACATSNSNVAQNWPNKYHIDTVCKGANKATVTQYAWIWIWWDRYEQTFRRCVSSRDL